MSGFRRVIILIVVIGLGATIWMVRGRAMAHLLQTQTYEDIYYLPPPKWLRVMSLGYRRALADLIWMRSLIYFGDEYRNEGTVRHVFRYGDSMLALDPDFRRVYRWVGMAGVYTPQGASLAHVRRALDVLRAGADRFPNDGRLAWDAGATIAYELMPLLEKDDPERPHLEIEANEYMMTAAQLGSGPAWLVLTNATVLRRLGEKDRELRHLEEMYAVVRDPDVKHQIEMRLAQLRTEAYADAFRRANEEFEERRQEEFPYMPPALYLLVADPIEAGSALEDAS